MKLWPWEYLFKSFDQTNFPDLHMPVLLASILMLIVTVAVYNVRTRQLHRHAIYAQMYEWLMWTGVITYSLMVVYWVFRFDFIIVLGTMVIGLGTMVWTRFRRFPPYFAAYERQLSKQRYFSRQRFAHPESTIRAKSSRRRRR
ncbi:MAG: hypothetical protein WCK58_11140 [Chloroflexota bacterium]